MRGDTSPEALAFLRERTSALSPEQRLAEGFAAIRLGRQLMRAGIRARHPDYDEDRVEHALARMLWDLKMPYMLVGSVAAMVHGRSRTTQAFGLEAEWASAQL